MTENSPSDPSGPLLEVDGLRTTFETEAGPARAVDGVSLSLRAGETLGLVGESGSGKSVTALSILGLVPSPPGQVTGGRILYRGRNLLQLEPHALRRLRGSELAMIFQEPMTALNPVISVGEQIAESVRLHRGASASEAERHAVEMLDRVGIPHPAARARSYPHELSGGMRQRVMIAMAMALDPAILIADEPTTALDVTIQAQILDLIADLQERSGTSVLLITHDLGVVAEMADRVVVLYAGQVVEEADVVALFERPRHPYTLGLLRSQPELAGSGDRLQAIPGVVPNPASLPSGCRFRTRCFLASERCAQEEPGLQSVAGGHRVACHHWEETPAR